ncbi:MAG: SDR family NAD(P)-dependent oxidoreductase [Candidatus Bathyarchaeota archaeon]|nr:MAG: SDR family NAD(P)-dependent oxidoreductase [Candidatus Bathyarchaeota archaeon]
MLSVDGTVLVTGGAGFIGSHIVDRLLKDGVKVRVVDDLSTGDKSNLSQHKNNPDFEFVQGDIRDFGVVQKAVKGVDAVVHEAALVSVIQSVGDPLFSNSINVVGSLNLLKASAEEKVHRFVFASSCAVYGACEDLPLTEESSVKPLSPYAVDKLAVENYARVFNEVSDLETVGLRYFNVYGPRQKCGPYCGVISVFLDSFLRNKSPVIFGDGEQTRDFVNVSDVVEANLCALTRVQAAGQVFNVCTGKATTVNKVLAAVGEIAGKSEIEAVYKQSRAGDIKHSYGDNSKAKRGLGFEAKVDLKTGLSELFSVG